MDSQNDRRVVFVRNRRLEIGRVSGFRHNRQFEFGGVTNLEQRVIAVVGDQQARGQRLASGGIGNRYLVGSGQGALAQRGGTTDDQSRRGKPV